MDSCSWLTVAASVTEQHSSTWYKLPSLIFRWDSQKGRVNQTQLKKIETGVGDLEISRVLTSFRAGCALVTASNRDLIGPVYPRFRAGRVSTAIGKALWAQPIMHSAIPPVQQHIHCHCLMQLRTCNITVSYVRCAEPNKKLHST